MICSFFINANQRECTILKPAVNRMRKGRKNNDWLNYNVKLMLVQLLFNSFVTLFRTRVAIAQNNHEMNNNGTIQNWFMYSA